jgi:hypothetical protein
MSEELKISHKNGKLGPVSSISRLSQVSCPNECSHYGSDCYATRLEKQYVNVRKAYAHNLNIKGWQKYRAALIEAKKKTGFMRIHVSGDFMITNVNGDKVLDLDYLDDLCMAYESLAPSERPTSWLYTHVADKRILRLEQYGVSVYGSVDTPSDIKRFKAEGFRLFAFKSLYTKKTNTMKIEQFGGIKAPVCWEQLGTKPDCVSCGYCISGKGHVTFLNH